MVNTAERQNYINDNFTVQDILNCVELNEIKQDAWQKFIAIGFPTQQSENYKYSPVNKQIEQDVQSQLFKLVSFNSNINYTNTINIKNGIVIDSNLDNGLNLINIETLIQSQSKYKDLILEHFNKQTNALELLNTACFKQAMVLIIQKNTSVDPIYINHIFEPLNTNTFNFSKLIVIAEPLSKATVVNSYSTINTHSSFNTCVEDYFLMQDSNIEIVRVQNMEANHKLHLSYNTYQYKHSSSNAITICLNASWLRNNGVVNFIEEHSEAHLIGLYTPNQDQHIDNQTTVNHLVPNCFSNEVYKGIVNNNGKAIFNGKIFVEKDAQKTNAYQSNKNILLSKEASVNTKPQLEIYANDVKCSHGSSTGILDPEMLFYLQARGINKIKAQKILLGAYVEEVLSFINLTELKNELSLYIEENL